MDKNGKINFKVKGNSNVHSCSLSLFKLIQEGNEVEVTAIGAGAVNQAVKIISRARANIAQSGQDLLVRPGMRNIMLSMVNSETGKTEEKEMSLAIFGFRLE